MTLESIVTVRIAYICNGTRIGVLVQVFDERIDVFDEHSVLEKKNPRRWVVVVEKMSSEKKGLDRRWRPEKQLRSIGGVVGESGDSLACDLL